MYMLLSGFVIWLLSVFLCFFGDLVGLFVFYMVVEVVVLICFFGVIEVGL